MQIFSQWTALLVLALLLTGACAGEGPDPEPVEEEKPLTTSVAVNLDQNAILGIVNDTRAAGYTCGSTEKAPVAALQWNDQLAEVARKHSQDMQDRDFFSHTNPDGTTAGERVKSSDYEGSYTGENIAYGYPDEEAVMTGWLNSAGHCKNIMNGKSTEIGIARSSNGVYWTMVLGKK